MNSFRFYIAKRYLLSKKEKGFISVISIISVIGITIGVAALIVILSVFNGFNGLVTSILVGFDPHIRLTFTGQTDGTVKDSILAFLCTTDQVAGYSAFVSGKAMIVSKNQSRVVFIRGLDPRSIGQATGIADKIVLGKSDPSLLQPKELILGLTLSDRLGVVTDDSVWIVSPAGVTDAMMGFGTPVIRSFCIRNIYESNNKEYDAMYAYMPLTAAQRLFRMGEKIHGYELRLKDFEKSEQMKSSLLSRFPAGLSADSWYDLHKDLYSVMQIERWSAYIILSLIIAVATFNLLGSLTMTVLAKTRDIGILKTLGATRSDIVAIFRYEGILVGITGTILGSILGYIICYLQMQFHLFPLDPTVYIIPAIPVEIRWFDFISVGTAGVGLSYLATILPSRRAADLAPASAIRWE